MEPVTGSEIQGTSLEGRIFCSAPSIRQCRCKSGTPWPGWYCYHQCQPWTSKKIPTDFLWEEGVETNKQGWFPVVYWLGQLTSMWMVAGLNLTRNPPLAAKAVDHPPLLHVFGTNFWIGNLHEVKLSNDGFERANAGTRAPIVQLLRTVRFWASLVRRNCLKFP